MSKINKKTIDKAPWLGEVPSNWIHMKVSHLGALGRGRVISNLELVSDGEYPVYSSQTFKNGEMGRINTYDFEGEYVTWTTDGANAGTVFSRTGRFNCTNVCGTIKPKKSILTKYLAYALSIETKRYVRLDINPKLMNTEMAQISVMVPPKQIQKKIELFLDKKTSEIDNLISYKEHLIELLLEKRQAVITESVIKGLDPNVRKKDSGIEWIGKIPESWKISKIKYQTEINKRSLGESTDKSLNIKYIDIGSVDSNGKIKNIENYSYGKAPSRAKRILIKGDTIVSTVRTYLKSITWIEKSVDNLIGSTGFTVLSPKKTIEPKYLSYLMRTENYIDEIVARSVGVSYPATTADEIGKLYCILPSKEEQKEIINHIESFFSKTDSLIEKNSHQILKLKEYRESLIYEAVTGKIDVPDYETETEEAY